MFKLGDKVIFKEEEYEIVEEFFGTLWGRKKYSRNGTPNVELPPGELRLAEPKRFKKEKRTESVPGKVKLSPKERGQILKDLVESESIKNNFRREIIILNKLIQNFPHRDFWIEGFKPALKVESLSYWYNRPEVEDLYKSWAINLDTKTEIIKLEETKVGEDIFIDPAKKKPKNLLELLK